MSTGNGGTRMHGYVKWYSTEKRFGFLTPDNGGTDVFVHCSDLEKSGLGGLTEGDKLSFETAPGKPGKGPKAVNLAVA